MRRLAATAGAFDLRGVKLKFSQVKPELVRTPREYPFHDSLEVAGVVLDTVVAVGANQINGISFGLEDSKAAEDEAGAFAVTTRFVDEEKIHPDSHGSWW